MSFLNCSNHPVEKWPPEQLAAARELGYGEPRDFPGGFPHVPPEATTLEVAALAERTAREVVASGARGAHVAGEFTFTFALVSALEAGGVACFAATTRRVSEEQLKDDGSIARRSAFRFVAWRRYPTPLAR